MLTLYKALEIQVTSDETSGTDKAKCAEIAVNIAIDVLKMESEGIKELKGLVAKNIQGKNILNDHHKSSHQSKNRYDDDESNNIQQEYDDSNRKF